LKKKQIKHFQACHLDPLLDDSITFARHLHSLSVAHHLVIIHGLPHGFLSFYNSNNDCKRASDRVMSDISRRYDITEQFVLLKKKLITDVRRKKKKM
jgi:hormone-sensitive lipase